jgi:1-acyl-sn-glycerol-3-phosphate acyltransferase
MILYRIVRRLLWLLSKVLFRLTVEGQEHIPRQGAFVMAPVHRSFADFALVATVTPRRMRFMGKDSLWKFKPLGWFISTLGAFPVHRGAADREALRTSIEVVQRGEPLVIFPEGTRRSGPVVAELFEGAAFVAARAGVPVVPVGIGGSEAAMAKGRKLPRLTRIHIVVGEPIPAAAPTESGRVSRKAVHAVTERLQADVQRLFDQAERTIHS